jgi:hypothetical protein
LPPVRSNLVEDRADPHPISPDRKPVPGKSQFMNLDHFSVMGPAGLSSRSENRTVSYLAGLKRRDAIPLVGCRPRREGRS